MRPSRSTRSAGRSSRPPAGSRARRALLPLLAGATLLLAGCSSSDVDAWKRGALPAGVTNHTDRVETLWQGAWIAALSIGALVWGLIF